MNPSSSAAALSLAALLGCDPASMSSSAIGIVGSGGKTSLMAWLARVFAARGRRVLLTTTTKVYPFPGVETLTDPVDLVAAFAADAIVCLGCRLGEDGKVEGDRSLDLAALRELADVILIEGDGARRRPLKVHLPHDPILPDDVDLAFAVLGASAVDQAVTEASLHRCDRIPEHWGLRLGDRLSANRIADLALRPEGYLSKVAKTPVRFLINQADDHPESARDLAAALGRRWPGPIVIGAAREGRFEDCGNSGPRVSLLLLAAGRSQRFAGSGEQDKRRLELKQRPLLDWSLAIYEKSRLLERTLVLRPGEEDLELARWGLRRGYRFLPLDHRDKGTQTESTKVGLRSISHSADYALIALADMPALRRRTIDQLLEAARARPERCLRTAYRGQPGHPVLLPRSAFGDLLRLSADQPVRELLPGLDPFLLECSDPGVILDLDVPEQAERIASHLHDRREDSDAV